MSDERTRRRADGDVGVPEWYSRGYLPHRDGPGLLQAITFRLADSLPQDKLRELEVELAHLSKEKRDAERRRRIEQWLDSGMGCCALGHPAVARNVIESLRYFDGDRYRLLAWCVMPNHVHVLLEPLFSVAKIVQGWKSVTARWALAQNESLQLGIPDSRHLWMREYWDRFIRDETHLKSAIDYIHNNPVKAALCRRPQEWLWSSAGAGNAAPGNADVHVGSSPRIADAPVGAEKKNADGDVGVPRSVGVPGKGV